ncbi:hypothetical protein JCGZ_17406 [Jatropha curcas]|uniref:RRM domain-containing protein n=1 Tax=Jatropha curcas TaxID=180498 RepID=A0A067LMZ6_JATCU|nr:organelle RRM domain-containing protein 6, chloroplastic [Jatropha curcas]XP_012079232.1 organelle RRM domain-containing protein 6, chloroplastic [Jatropha curcas]KDP45799.1 hypothetical protein JCGZ_17406 [Jatropha curcas]
MAASAILKITPPPNSTSSFEVRVIALSTFPISLCASSCRRRQLPLRCLHIGRPPQGLGYHRVLVSSSSSSSTPQTPKTRLFVSGLSFRTTEESLRNAFQNFGQLVEMNLVMDKVANRPRGFAFLRYATEEDSQKAIEGMHGKFLDGRVIFVEVAKPRRELRQGLRQS